MLLLVYVHGYNVGDRYLQPFTTLQEPINLNTFIQYFTANGIFRFRIPMLFAISGYLFSLGDSKDFAVRIQKRIRTLLVPYILWGMIALLLTWLMQWSAWGQWAITSAHLWGDTYTPIEQQSLQQLFFRSVLFPVAFQLWFIRCLFVYNLLYPLLVVILQKTPKIWFGFIGLIWFSTMHFYFIEGEGLLFFTLGIWMQKNQVSLEEPPTRMRLSIITPLWIILLLGKTWLAFHGRSWIGPFATDSILVLLHKLTIVLGLIVCWFGCDRMVHSAMKQRWFVWCSSFSFIIYALHAPLINYLIEPSIVFFHDTTMAETLSFLLLPIFVGALCIGVGYCIRIISPALFSLLTGNRGMEHIKTVSDS